MMIRESLLSSLKGLSKDVYLVLCQDLRQLKYLFF